MTQAYHQLEIDEDSRQITTFSTHFGLFRYKRLLFGVNAASEIFQNAIANVLHDIPGSRNLSDDIIVFGATQQEHDRSLKKTLQRLQEVGARLNRQKCIFSASELTFFGHVFGRGGMTADPEKTKTIINAPAPTNIAELRSFLGMTQYMARYIPAYATITSPLRELLKKDVTWTWSAAQQAAFEKLKEMLTSSPVMAYFDPVKETSILVDASPVGLGAILVQDNKAICYSSRALTDVEKRYSQTDREMLAAVYGIEHFHLYVQGAPFKLITDHKPLLGMVKSRNPTTARIERWRLRLMPYEVEFVYRPGRNEHNPADYISRHPQTTPARENAGEEYIAFLAKFAVPKAMTQDEVRAETQKDPQLQTVMQAVQTGQWRGDISDFARFKDELSVHDGLVLRGHRLILPQSLQKRAIDIAHQSHQGIVKTKQLIRKKIWFPGIDKLVENTVKSCIPCQATYKGPTQREPLQPTPLPSGPWVAVAIDFAGPFPSGEYVLVVTDEYSRYPEVEIVPSTSERVVLPRLDQIFARQGFPEICKTDNGPPFNGQAFAKFAEKNGFRHRKITPVWPEANGAAERFVETIKNNIRASAADGRNWKEQIPTFLRTFRATPHSTTGVSPFEAMTGRKMNVGLPTAPKRLSPVPVHTRVAHNDNYSKGKMAEYVNARRHTAHAKMAPDDYVLVKQPKQNALTTPYNATPCLVKEKKGSMVTACRPDGSLITRNSSHFRQLPPHITVPGDVPEVDDPEAETPPPDINIPGDIIPIETSLTGDTGNIDASSNQLPSPSTRRSGRATKTPSYLKDYVLD